MPELVYQGPLPSGYVKAPDGRIYPFERGKPLEMPDAVCQDLLKADPDAWDVPEDVAETPAAPPPAPSNP